MPLFILLLTSRKINSNMRGYCAKFLSPHQNSLVGKQGAESPFSEFLFRKLVGIIPSPYWSSQAMATHSGWMLMITFYDAKIFKGNGWSILQKSTSQNLYTFLNKPIYLFRLHLGQYGRSKRWSALYDHTCPQERHFAFAGDLESINSKASKECPDFSSSLSLYFMNFCLCFSSSEMTGRWRVRCDFSTLNSTLGEQIGHGRCLVASL